MRQEILDELARVGMTQRELARRVKMPEQRISEWLSGKLARGTSERTINKVMKALGLKVTPTK